MKASRIRKLSWRLLVVYSVIVLLIAFADRTDHQKYLRWWFWTGVAVVAVGAWVRIWAAGHLVKNKVLTVTGPYAYVKNPLYIGTFFCMVGFAVMARGTPGTPWWQQYMNWILLGVGVLVFVVYYAPFKQKREGDRLRDIFGEAWDHYHHAVPGYFPKLTRYERATDRPWSWAAVCENSEQWVPLAIVAGIAILLFSHEIIPRLERLLP